MPLDTTFQLSFELTKVFGIARQAASATQALVAFAKQLRNSGSDIIVEEDLADVFGRMRIEHTIEAEFKRRVLVETTIVPLYSQCEIQLQQGPGPTVQRAFRDQDRRYLSTVIQLSMLASLHDRNELAAAISEQLNNRAAAGLPGATFSPGFEGILKTLEACTSQTNTFVWYGYTQSVQIRLWEVLGIPRDMSTLQNTGVLRQDVLLAAMDYLCLVQSLPEDRKMVVHVLSGCIPLIVWAHHLLGLTVQVIWRRKELRFGTGDPQVIVHPGSRYGSDKADGSTPPAASLLDSGMEVVLAQTPQSLVGVKLSSQERHAVGGIGTEFMRRYFHAGQFIVKSSALLYAETAQLIVALAIYKSPNLHRVRSSHDASAPQESLPYFTDLEQWRIWRAAQAIFQGIEIDGPATTSYVQRLAAFKSEDLTIGALDLPTSLDTIIRLEGVDEDPSQKSSLRQDVEFMIAKLTTLLLTIAHIKEVEKCVDMPLVLDFDKLISDFGVGFSELIDGGQIPLEESTVFYGLASLLLGPTFKPSNYERCFLICERGWSIYLGCCDDCDPATVRPELISVHRGVPTDLKTQERKLRMADFGPPGLLISPITTLDRGADYEPRCVTPIVSRTEYFTSGVDSFLLHIRLIYEGSDPLDAVSGSAITSYRSLHASLWEIYSTNREARCRHSGRTSAKAKLHLGVVTAEGFGWGEEAEGPLKGSIPERICISLVAGDHRARWLTAENASKSRARRTLLRGSDCCPDCALQMLAKLEGKWILIL